MMSLLMSDAAIHDIDITMNTFPILIIVHHFGRVLLHKIKILGFKSHRMMIMSIGKNLREFGVTWLA